ncbi:MAG TPA: hypothetical protein VEU96_01055 [Bryobacteraceae bacterium]|nr:hypothetical protein [Bryobacteraceae bacterium]
MTASLRALLANLIDYAGLYPPAALPLAAVIENYRRYLASPDGWILNRLVLPAAKLHEVRLGGDWRVTLLVDGEPGPLPHQIEALETKAGGGLSLPTYCEVPLDQVAGGFAKVRTGGLTPDAIPSPSDLADFLCESASRRLPFKATAGLHHPIRSDRRLTYAADSPRAVMHGFVNVFAAAAFAWHGMERNLVLDVLKETNAASFEFGDEQLRWRGHQLTAPQIAQTRRYFAHSFGSCSFEEPLDDLRELGWLP